MATLNYLMGKSTGEPLIISTNPYLDAQLTGLIVIGIQTAIPKTQMPKRRKSPKYTFNLP